MAPLPFNLYAEGRLPHRRWSVVVFQAKVGNQVRAHDVAQGVLELHRLDEQVVLRIQALSRLRRLQVEAQPLLNTDRAQLRRAFGQVEEQHQVERDGSGQNRVAAEEVH